MNIMPNNTGQAPRADRAIEPGAHVNRSARSTERRCDQHGPLPKQATNSGEA
jgi:hypothetical protein